MPDPKSRVEECSKLKIGRYEVHDDTDNPSPHLGGEWSEVKVIRSYRHSNVCLPIKMDNEKSHGREVSMPRLTFLQGQKVRKSRSPRCLTL